MAAELIIAPEAQQDIEEAYGWFEERRAGKGELLQITWRLRQGVSRRQSRGQAGKYLP